MEGEACEIRMGRGFQELLLGFGVVKFVHNFIKGGGGEKCVLGGIEEGIIPPPPIFWNNLCRVSRFNSVSSILLYFPSNHGAENTRIYYIGLRGEVSEVMCCTYICLSALPTVILQYTSIFCFLTALCHHCRLIGKE